MWDQIYQTEEYVYGKLPNDFLREHYTAIPKGKVLFLAEGEGRNAVFLAKHGYQITAVDLSSVALEKANRLARENQVKIETICHDLATFDLGTSCWDGIVSIFCHLPPVLRKSLYQRVEEALTAHGVFLLEAYRPEQLNYKTGGPAKAELMVTKQALLEELPNLTFSHVEEIERDVTEGSKHTGMAAVVQAIGSLAS